MLKLTSYIASQFTHDISSTIFWGIKVHAYIYNDESDAREKEIVLFSNFWQFSVLDNALVCNCYILHMEEITLISVLATPT